MNNINVNGGTFVSAMSKVLGWLSTHHLAILLLQLLAAVLEFLSCL